MGLLGQQGRHRACHRARPDYRDQDGVWDKTIWKTEAFYGNALTGLPSAINLNGKLRRERVDHKRWCNDAQGRV